MGVDHYLKKKKETLLFFFFLTKRIQESYFSFPPQLWISLQGGDAASILTTEWTRYPAIDLPLLLLFRFFPALFFCGTTLCYKCIFFGGGGGGHVWLQCRAVKFFEGFCVFSPAAANSDLTAAQIYCCYYASLLSSLCFLIISRLQIMWTPHPTHPHNQTHPPRPSWLSTAILWCEGRSHSIESGTSLDESFIPSVKSWTLMTARFKRMKSLGDVCNVETQICITSCCT